MPQLARVSGVDSQACFAEVVHTLLTSGADVNAIGENGWSVLHCLAINPNPRLRVPRQRDVARHLIQHGARPDVKDSSGRLALHHAVDTGHLHLLCALADAAPGLITAQAWGTELLSAAAKAGRRDIVQELLRRNGADGPLMVSGWVSGGMVVAAVYGRARPKAGKEMDARRRVPACACAIQTGRGKNAYSVCVLLSHAFCARTVPCSVLSAPPVP